jgi:hypothetical protein
LFCQRCSLGVVGGKFRSVKKSAGKAPRSNGISRRLLVSLLRFGQDFLRVNREPRAISFAQFP